MCFQTYHACACGKVITSTLDSCRGMQIVETLLQHIELGTSSNLASWDPQALIKEHVVTIRRVYQQNCECITASSYPGDAVFTNENAQNATPAVSFTRNGLQANVFKSRTQSFALIAACGHQVERQERMQLQVRFTRQFETMEVRSYIAEGPTCNACMAQTSKATSIESLMQEMGSLGLEKSQVESLEEAMSGLGM